MKVNLQRVQLLRRACVRHKEEFDHEVEELLLRSPLTLCRDACAVFLPDKLFRFQLEEADYAHHITTYNPKFCHHPEFLLWKGCVEPSIQGCSNIQK